MTGKAMGKGQLVGKEKVRHRVGGDHNEIIFLVNENHQTAAKMEANISHSFKMKN